MDNTMRTFNQINSLCYWFQFRSNYKCTIIIDGDKDSYFINLKKGGKRLYAHHISDFSKKNNRFLQFELTAIANSLLHVKETILSRQKQKKLKEQSV